MKNRTNVLGGGGYNVAKKDSITPQNNGECCQNLQDYCQICKSVECVESPKCVDKIQENICTDDFDSKKVAFNIYKYKSKNIIENVHIADTNFAKNKKCAKGVLDMVVKSSIKVNKRKILAVVISLWLVALGLLLGVFFSVDNERQNAIAAPSGYGTYYIAVQVTGLNLSDELYAELKNIGWKKTTEVAYIKSEYSEYKDTICYYVGGFDMESRKIVVPELALPISILEKTGNKIKLISTFGNKTYEYTKSNNTMTEYDSGAFESVGYDTNDFCALLVTISIEEPNQLNLTIGFDNLGFVDTSLVLYVFNNDTNEMLYTNTVVISGTENTLSLAMDRSVTAARITLAVPYLWQITWVGADSYINKSAIVNLAANTTISAKINIIDGYNNIIII